MTRNIFLSQLRQYLFAIGCVGLAILLRQALYQYAPHSFAYVFFYIAVAIISRYTSLGPSILSSIASVATSVYFFDEPHFSSQAPLSWALGAGLRLLVFGSIIFLGESLRRTSERLASRAAALEASQERLRLALGASQTGIWEWDIQTNEVTWSPETYVICGFQSGAFASTAAAFGELLHPDDAKLFWEKLNGAVASHSVFSHEFRIVRPDGNCRWLANVGRASYSETGEPLRLLGTVTDITTRKRSEAERYQFVSLAENSTDFVGLCDREFRPFFINPAGLRMVGLPDLDAGQNAKVHDFFFPEDHRLLEDFFPKVMQQGSGEIEIRFRHFKTGEAIWVIYKVSATFDDTGRFTGYATVTRNVTEERRSQTALRESNERLQAALIGAQAGTFRWDIQSNALEWDENLDSLFGLAPGQTVRSLENFIEMVHPDDRPQVIAGCERCAREGADFALEFRVVWPDGSLHWLYDKGKTFFDADGKPLYMTGACVDVSAQRRTEEALRVSQERYALAESATNDGLWDWDITTGYDYLSPRWKALLGYQPDELPDHESTFFGRVHPDDVPILTDALGCSSRTQSLRTEFRLRCKDGQYRWFLTRAEVICDATGKPVRMVGAMTDINDAKLAEAALRKAEKLAGAGQMAAVVAHEINNPLAGVVNSLYLLGTQPLSAEGKQYLQLAWKELERVVHITKQTLAFYREADKASEFDVSDVVKQVIEFYQPMALRLDAQLEAATLQSQVVHGFPNELRQVLSNLVTNALEAGGTRVRIRVSDAHEWSSGSRRVRLTVTDNGKGISRDDIRKIFEPFFTTKGDKGTGLGLWVTRGIINKHEGKIRIRSKAGVPRGVTCVSIWLPAVRSEAGRVLRVGAAENVA